MKLLITGGAGFIGSNFIRYYLEKHPDDFIINYDKLTYAGNLDRLKDLEIEPNYKFVKGDITDAKRVEEVVKRYEVDQIIHFAAETHVDRSIENPSVFIETNVLGTQVLLEAARKCKVKRFHHVSTDEVFGALDLKTKEKFDHKTTYNPSSPYSASKAGSDHLVRSYFRTYGLPVTISNCSNNFGPYQDPEKFLPRAITNVIEGKKIPIYGDGKYVRDWMHVVDHCRAIDKIIHEGKDGETYVIGGQKDEEVSNMDIAKKILKFFGKDETFLEKVEDRPGHDRKYSIDSAKVRKDLGWEPVFNFDNWLTKTCEWYRDNEWWWRPLKIEAEKFYRDKRGMGDYIFAKQEIKETTIPGVLIIKRPVFKDNRGFFREIVRNAYLTKLREKSLNSSNGITPYLYLKLYGGYTRKTGIR
jgi:dTDP-glucose 4,6-dehydratase